MLLQPRRQSYSVKALRCQNFCLAAAVSGSADVCYQKSPEPYPNPTHLPLRHRLHSDAVSQALFPTACKSCPAQPFGLRWSILTSIEARQ